MSQALIDKIFCSIESNDFSTCIFILENHPQLIKKAKTISDWTPLSYACRYNKVELFKELGRRFYDIKTVCEDGGATLLIPAIYSMNEEFVKMLLDEYSLRPYGASFADRNPLREALKTSNSDIIELLMKRGAVFTCGNLKNNFIIQPPNRIFTLDGISIESEFVFNVSAELKDEGMKLKMMWLRYKNFFILHNVLRKQDSEMEVENENSKTKMFRKLMQNALARNSVIKFL